MVACRHLVGAVNGWCVVCGRYVGKVKQQQQNGTLLGVAKSEYERLRRDE